MSIAIDRLLAHMKWANRLTIEHLQSLSDEALKSFAINSDWFVGEIMHHIVDSADYYAYRITGKRCDVSGEKIQELESIKDLEFLKTQAEVIDSALQECAKLDDIQMEFENYAGKLVKRWRSTILSQAIHHATEHRAQIASALEAKGFTPVDLDELDLWAFEIEKN